jgi:predicted transposase YdaD
MPTTPYDIAAKVLIEKCSHEILRRFFEIPVTAATLLELLPQETTSVRRSDFPLMVHGADGRRRLVILEVQSEWDPDLPLRVLEYRCRHKLRHDVETLSGVLLLRPSVLATDHYEDNEVSFRFRLLKVYELEAEAVVAEGALCLLPLLPLMRDGLRWAEQADRMLYASDLPPSEKSDLLTILAIMSGLVSRELATALVNKRRDIMITSYTYELIKQEGLQEGLERGLKEGLQEGLERGLKEGLERGLKEGLERGRQEGLAEGLRTGLLQAIGLGLDMRFGPAGVQLLPEIAAITDVGVLQQIFEQLRTVSSPDELRAIYRRR